MHSLHSRSDGPLVHGTDPQFLIEKIIRERIFESLYWKEVCYGLNVYTWIEKAALDLNYVGGVFGANQKPVPFLCLLLKLLQLQPPKDVVLELIKCSDFKYLQALSLIYFRLVCGSALEIYLVLEPFLSDYKKLRIRHESGEFGIIHVDEFVDELLSIDRVLSIILPRLSKRAILELDGALPLRESPIQWELEELLLEKGLSDTEDMQSYEGERSAEATKEQIVPFIPKKSGKLSFKQQAKNGTKEEDEDPALAVLAAKKAAKAELDASLSIEATNELRTRLGLKPLKR